MPALTIDIEARLAQFQDGLERVERAAGRTARQLDASFAGLRQTLGFLAGGFAVGGIVAGLKQTVDELAALDDSAQKTGASVESLSSILNTLAPTGVTIEQITDIAGKLTRAMAGAEDETKGAGEAFAALGVATRDSAGNLRPVDEVLRDVANSLAGYSDSANKVAIAQRLLGKSGAEYLPVLNDLAGLSQQSASVTAEQAKAAADLSDNIGVLTNSFKILKQELVAGVLPALSDFFSRYVALSRQGSGPLRLIEGLIGPNPDERVAQLERRIGELTKLRERLAQQGDPSALLRMFNPALRTRADVDNELVGLSRQLQEARELQRTLQAVQGGSGPAQVLPAPALRGAGAASSAARAAREQLREVEDYAARIQKSVADAIQDNDLTRAREYADRIEELDRLFFDAGLDVETYDAALRKLAGIRPPNDITEELQRQADLIRESLDPLAKFRKELELIDKLELNNLLTGSEASLKRFLIGNEIDGLVTGVKELSAATDEASNFARDLGLTFSSAFEDAVVGGNSLRDVLEGLGKDLLRIGTRKLVTEPLGKFFEQMVTGGGGSSGNWISTLVGSFFGGARADGGPVSAGRSYLVGERGPEMFVPAMSGAIVPNGAGGTVVNMTVVTQDAESFRRSEGQIAQRLSGIASRGSRFA